jgi:hypothetical protein
MSSSLVMFEVRQPTIQLLYFDSCHHSQTKGFLNKIFNWNYLKCILFLNTIY